MSARKGRERMRVKEICASVCVNARKGRDEREGVVAMSEKQHREKNGLLTVDKLLLISWARGGWANCTYRRRLNF